MSARPLLGGGIAILFILAVIFGGGGAEGHAQNGLIAAVGSLAFAIVLGQSLRDRWPSGAHGWIPRILALSLLGLLLVQLIPLPPVWWHSLPGRSTIVEALRLSGGAETWRPVSVDPAATWRSATFLLAPLALYFYTLSSDRTVHLRLIKTLAAGSGVSGLIGAAQLALGHPAWLSFYDGPNVGSASGVFANPNHQALLMSFGLVACAIFVREGRPARVHSERLKQKSTLFWAGMVFFAVMTLASGSRAGLMLLAIALPGSLLIAKGSQSLLRWAGGLIAIVALLWVIILLYPGTNTLAVRESFRLGEDARYAYLPDIFYTLQQYWPAGSGFGTFVTVISPNENLDIAQRGYLNHAHNDFLEWLIETGLPGLIWLILAAAIVTYFGFRKLREAKDGPGLVLGACLIIILTTLHSLADYPLRTVSIACAVSLAIGILCSSPERVDRGEKQRGAWIVIAAFLIALPIAAESLRLNLVRYAERENDLSLVAKLDPDNASVLVQGSMLALERQQFSLAEALAVRAVNSEPLNPATLRQLALSLEAQKRDAGKVWQLASLLGWRDAPTQYWAFRQALIENEPEVAALRADALLRTSQLNPEFVSLLRVAVQNPALAGALANRLSLDPPWRALLFTVPANAKSDEISGLVKLLERHSKGGNATRGDLRSLVAYLINANKWDQAVLIDRLVPEGANKGGNLLSDGGFDRLEDDYAQNSTPFDWQVSKGPHAAGSIETAPPTRLVVDSDGEQTSVAAHRYLEMAPGRYILAFQARADNADSFQVRVMCANSSSEATAGVIPRSAEFRKQSLIFHVAPSCSIMQLLIEALPAGAPATVEFDEFQIKAD